jgi:hypothetical protein
MSMIQYVQSRNGTVYKYVLMLVNINKYCMNLWMNVHALNILCVPGVVSLGLVHAVVDDDHGAHVVDQLPALLQHPQVPRLGPVLLTLATIILPG